MVADQIEREVVIDAPVERVWTTLTSAEHLGKWFGDSGAEIELKPGGKLVLHFKEYGDLLGLIEKVESPHTFAYRWFHGPNLDPVTTPTTFVEFSLSPEGNGTRLRVVESGFATIDVPNPQEMYDVHVEGWKSELNELLEYSRALVPA